MKKIFFAVLLFILLPAGCAGLHPGPEAPPPAPEQIISSEGGQEESGVISCRPGQPPPLPERLKEKLFDTAVNTGVSQASKFLQSALNRLGAGLALDGKIGPKTLSALCGISEPVVLTLYAERQAEFYRAIVDRKPDQARFLNGWLRRAAWLPDEH
ncbi:MAG: hypothetical protein FWG97_03880 [Deltaproteobacteria bacterium]|nr:hypothetical protein [Deltaproteobacteria bacterium]